MAKEIVAADVKAVKELLIKSIGNGEYSLVERMGGLTNRTYRTCYDDGQEYIVRIPGEGTETMIVREDEKISTELACNLGIDAELLYFGEKGEKVTKYIKDAVTMNSETMKADENIKASANIFRILHKSGVDTRVPFEVFDMASGYEKIIQDKCVDMYDDYSETKEMVMQIKKELDSVCNIEKVPCHNDPLCENWVKSGDRMYLIDWEYAGMNDGYWDLADVSIEAGYNREQEERLMNEYLGYKPTDVDWRRFYANKVYVDFLWTLWAKTRVPYDGEPMEEWATERYHRLKNTIEFFTSK